MSPAEWKTAKAVLQGWREDIPPVCRLRGSGTKDVFLDTSEASAWSPPSHLGVFSFSSQDQVLCAWAGTSIAEVQEEAARYGLGLPIPRTGHHLVDGLAGTVGGWCAANLPHGLTRWFGPPRDSVLGMGVILADGTTAKSGASVVKSVAGYDIHRFFCGSWGDLGVIGLVFLRLTPLKALPKPQARVIADWRGEPAWVQRVLPSDFLTASQQEGVLAADPASSTVWLSRPPKGIQPGWVLAPGERPAKSPTQQRAKDVFDPQGRWR
jgi:FAD/FMN-containing dehydrogenase